MNIRYSVGPTWCRERPPSPWHLASSECAPEQPTAYHSTVPSYPFPPFGEMCLACKATAGGTL